MKTDFITIPLSSLFQIISGQAPPSEYYNNKEIGYPFLKVNNFTDRIPKVDTWTTKSLKECRLGDVLLSVAGSVGFVNMGIEASITRSIFALRPNDKTTTDFLFYLLRYHSKKIANLSTGSAQQIITSKMLSDYFVDIPEDIYEQSQIATILSTLDRAIASTEQLIAKYQRIKTGLLHDLLTRGIDEHGNLRSEKTHKFKDSKLGRIPVEWECKRLGEIYTDLKSGSTPLRKNKAYFENGTFLWVKTLDLNEDDIFDTQEKITKRAIEESSCSLFPINSVLIAMYGGWEQIGRTAVLKKEATTNQAITALFNPRVDIVVEYIQFFLQHFRYKWKSFAVSTRKDPNITKTDIQNFLIAFPKEDVEQQSIVK
ncbi:MAG: restriction endonuclease subunit S, partial [Acholeplasmataceae bacterium]|nr:restriction endonuclease subunit S [Acholeplasmataceae bacterium]